MLTLQPVISRVAAHITPFDLWPISTPDAGWLRLHDAMTSAEVGMAIWSLMFHTGPIGDDVPVPSTPAAAVRLLIDADVLYGAGGLLLTDATRDATVEPGCCCDLFEWRDWLDALEKRPIDLGHSPSPKFEYRGDTFRVWADDRDRRSPALALESRRYIDVERAALPSLLRSAQHDLTGFLAAADTWIHTTAPEHAESFLSALDNGLDIGRPLPL